MLLKRHQEFRKSKIISKGTHSDLSEIVLALWSIYSGPTLHAWQELVNAARTDTNLRDKLAGVNQRFFSEAQHTLATLVNAKADEVPRLAATTRFAFAILDGLALNQVLEDNDANSRDVLSLLEEVGCAWRSRLQSNNTGRNT